MAKPILFNLIEYTDTAKEYQSNDPDLTFNGGDLFIGTEIIGN